MKADTVLLGFPEYRQQSQRLAGLLDVAYADISLHHFPDGESQLTLPANLPEKVIVCRSLHDPNSKIVELLLAAGSARRHGARSLTLVAPYLCYMRQDKEFHRGEVISQRIIGDLLASHFDHVLTVDAHLHRVHALIDAIPARQAVNVTATEPMARFLRQREMNPLLIGPDAESQQWVAAIAARDGFDYVIASKRRLGDRSVEITLPDYDYRGRHIVLVDDVASTGKTLQEVIRQLAAFSPASVSVLVTHALFVDQAIDALNTLGVTHIWSCDSIPHPTNAIELAPLLAASLDKMLWQ